MNFKDLTTISCGGNIKYVYFPKNIDSLRLVFKHINYFNIKYALVGNGSNILATDDYFDGVVILLRNLEASFQTYDDHLICSAFYQSIRLAYDLAKLRIGDLSFLGGIPGLIGGAVKQNSGAYGDEIKNHLIEVKYIDTLGDIKTISCEEMMFKYRYSIFHDITGIIIEAKFKIGKNISTTDKLLSRRIARSASQPLGTKNMGSIFKNPDNYNAWEVVDKLNLRGFQINDAAVSTKHANFIINLGNAKTEDIISIIEFISKKSKDELGIDLEYEINLVS